MTFTETMDDVAVGVEFVGVGVLAVGLIWSAVMAPTMSNVLVLGLIVVIRTFLSFSLQIEMEAPAATIPQGNAR